MKKSMIICLVAAVGATAWALPKSGAKKGTTVTDSTIVNVNRDATITARNRSRVNTGIQARGATIRNSTLTNRFSGKVNAVSSDVTTGIKADGATISDSEINVDTRGNIRAVGSTVKTGVDISGARNAEINTSYKGNINAAGAKVEAGLVKGNVRHKKITTDVSENINAMGRGVKIGTVAAGDGRPSRYLGKEGNNYGRRGRSGARIGNVKVQGATVREVKTSVGSNKILSGLKTRHMARVYKEKGGVDPSGTKHVYVSRKQKERAKKTGGAVGNTTVRGGGRIRRVHTFVE